jgi:hypothetical protein
MSSLGTVLLFDSLLIHRSLANLTKEWRIVYSFHINHKSNPVQEWKA